MIEHPFDPIEVRKALNHFKMLVPEEGCGFIHKGKFVPVDNISEEKIMTFEIDPREYLKYADGLECILHSHYNYDHVSKKDMLQQIASKVPWGIIFLRDTSHENMIFFGDQLEPYDLIGRSFVHGVHDCYGLVRDYYRLKGITLPIFPRDNLWWEREPSMIMDNYKEAGFEEIEEKDIQEGDVFVAQILADVVNHTGIVLDNGLILHHLYTRLSRRDNHTSWKKFIRGYYRYVGDNK